MIAPGNTNHTANETTKQNTSQAALAVLERREPVCTPRWACDVCGMIHTGTVPLKCDSCGSELLSQQPDTHCEMNSHW